MTRIETINFAGASIALIREEEVVKHLSLDQALEDMVSALQALANGRAVNRVRSRVDWRELFQDNLKKKNQNYKDRGWLHTLRAGFLDSGLVGGKDYTSLGFETPAMWVTVVNSLTGKPIALIEADYLSRVRTATTAAVATDLLAPRDVRCLCHFGAGKISELLIRAILRIRPSLERVLLVRKNKQKGEPSWLSDLDVDARLLKNQEEIAQADILTTATNSIHPVLTFNDDLSRLKHINLIGANHPKRQEIDKKLASRCLPQNGGYLVLESTEQGQIEAGEFMALAQGNLFNWKDTPTLDRLLTDSQERKLASAAKLTAFKSVGIGLTDLAVAIGVLRRMGLVHRSSYPPQK